MQFAISTPKCAVGGAPGQPRGAAGSATFSYLYFCFASAYKRAPAIVMAEPRAPSGVMEVLKMRCTHTVTELSTRRFRLTYPPHYECEICYKSFILKAHYSQHRLDDECDDHLQQLATRGDVKDASQLHSSGKYIANAISKGALLLSSNPKNTKNRESRGDSSTSRAPASSTSIVQSCVCWSLAEPIVGAALKPIEIYLRPSPL